MMTINDVDDPVCAYCEEVIAGEATRDHVVPSLLWLKGERPNHPVIVKACRPCHGAYDREAEYFRNILMVMSDIEAHPMIQELSEGPVVRSVRRRPSVMRDLSRDCRFEWEPTESGHLVQPSWKISMDVSRFNRMIEKIVRGLFFFKSSHALPTTHEVKVWPGNGFLENPGFQNVLPLMESHQNMGDNVFACRCHRDVNDPAVTVWLFLFYGHIAVFAWTLPTNHQHK